jgi:hypothetical protein
MHIDELYKIIKHGKLFYTNDDDYYTNSSVQCDRCFRNSLNVYIGYQGNDLCLDCVKILTDKDFNRNKFPIPLTTMNQNIYNNDINNIIPNNPDNYITYMHQDLFDHEKYLSFFIVKTICKYNYGNNGCKHDVIFNGKCMTLDGSTIANKYWEYLNDFQKNHFSKYKNKF